MEYATITRDGWPARIVCIATAACIAVGRG